MTGKQGNRAESKRGEQTIFFSAETMDHLVQACIRLLLGAVLSGGVILENCAPFGVALTAASGGGLVGGGAALGACLGSLCQLELTQGLRYAAADMLVYAAAFAFYDVKPLRRAWTMPLTAGAAMVFTGLVAHSRMVWTGREKVCFVLEVLLTLGSVWCFRAALRRPGLLPRREGISREQRGGVMILTAAVLTALIPLKIGALSLGRVLGGGLTLWWAWLGGSSAGGVLGIILGLAADLAGEGRILYAMAWPLGGLAAGGLCRRGRGAAAVAWVLTLCACGAWAGDDLALVLGGEGAVSGLLIAALPGKWLKRGEYLVVTEGGTVRDPGGCAAARHKLEGAARAYQTLCSTLKDTLRPPVNDGDVSLVFDRAAGRVCRSCANQNLCWHRDYSATFNALNDATAPMLERGKAVGEDFPPHFAHRCIHFSDLLGAVNEELTALFYRRQYQARIRDSRSAVCQQYDQLSQLLYETAEELGGELTPDPTHRRGLSRYLAQHGGGAKCGVYRDGRGLLRLRLEGPGAGEFSREKELGELSALVGKPLRLERAGDGEVLLVEEEPLMALAGVAARKKEGETVSGDGGTYFKCPNGKAYLLLCDGMGSGEQASRESGLAIRLLEQFLGAGITPDNALLTLTSALALRGEETGGFTTVDLLELDLFTGEGALYKLGAVPTYVRQGDAIRRLTGNSLPAGLSGGGEEGVDRFTLRLSPGDVVVMVSDGVCTAGEDGWLMERLRPYEGSPRQLAARLIADSPQGAADDRTVLVVRLERRE